MAVLGSRDPYKLETRSTITLFANAKTGGARFPKIRLAVSQGISPIAGMSDRIISMELNSNLVVDLEAFVNEKISDRDGYYSGDDEVVIRRILVL
jgi:hypothetical protein